MRAFRAYQRVQGLVKAQGQQLRAGRRPGIWVLKKGLTVLGAKTRLTDYTKKALRRAWGCKISPGVANIILSFFFFLLLVFVKLYYTILYYLMLNNIILHYTILWYYQSQSLRLGYEIALRNVAWGSRFRAGRLQGRCLQGSRCAPRV